MLLLFTGYSFPFFFLPSLSSLLSIMRQLPAIICNHILNKPQLKSLLQFFTPT